MSKHLAHNNKLFGSSRFEAEQSRKLSFDHLKQFAKKDRMSYPRQFTQRDLILAFCSSLFLVISLIVRSHSIIRNIFCVLSFAAASAPLLILSVREIMRQNIPVELVTQLLAGIILFMTGRFYASCLIVLFFLLSYLAQCFVQMRKDLMLSAAIDLLPEKVKVKRDTATEEVLPEAVSSGDILVVSEGERVPIDGVIHIGTAQFDTFDLDGEIGTRQFFPGDAVPAGYLLKTGTVLIKATNSFERSAQASFYYQMKYADAEKTKPGKMIHAASQILTLSLLLLGLVFLAVALVKAEFRAVWLNRAVTCFIVSSFSVFSLSSYFSLLDAVFSSANYGIVFSEESKISLLAKVKSFVFSKTGTVTEGQYTITDIVPEKMKSEDLLRIAALAEINSRHPIAVALKRAAGLSENVQTSVIDVEEIPGKGISAFLGGKQIYVGNANFLEEHGIWYRVPNKSGSAIHVAIDGNYSGYIMIADKIRENAFDALEQLREQGIASISMLTGDVRSVARPIASSLNFDMVKSELTPEGKSTSISYLRASAGDKIKIAFVGDGVHDRIAFSASDVGIVHDARTAYSDGASVSVFGTDLRKISQAHRIAKSARMILLVNGSAVLFMKILCLILGLSSIFPAALVAGLDAIASIFCMANCLRGFYLN